MRFCVINECGMERNTAFLKNYAGALHDVAEIFEVSDVWPFCQIQALDGLHRVAPSKLLA